MARTIEGFNHNSQEESDIERNDRDNGSLLAVPQRVRITPLAGKQPNSDPQSELNKPTDEEHMPVRRSHPDAPPSRDPDISHHDRARAYAGQQPAE